MHEMITCEIAKSRFNIDDWHITTNSRISENHGTDTFVPDIVARHSDDIVAIGSVEIHTTPLDDRVGHWKNFGESCPRFYLFVPEGTELSAAELIKQHKISCAGLRSYSVNGHVDIKSVHLDDVLHREDEHPWWSAIGGSDQ
jgi:hypothetical protein